MNSIDEQLTRLTRGTVAINEECELVKKLKEKRPLRVKLGVDPTAGDLHLGFTVVLRKLRDFQDMGHRAILIIGSYTAQVGDPSGRDKTRPQLTEEDVMRNAENYLTQAAAVLDRDSLEVQYNGEWFKSFAFMDVIKLLSHTTVARTLEREDFSGRFTQGTPIYMHEMVYPLMQGYDSVMIHADVELGGTDQTFNLMVARDLQRDAGQEPQVCITMPILEGLDGVRKMSKSYDNYIGISDAPNDMFGKIMSISDELMWKYYELLTRLPKKDISELLTECKNGTRHPMDIKKKLARTITAQYHSDKAAEDALAHFENVFSRKNVPDDIPAYTMPKGTDAINLLDIIIEKSLAASKSDARRLVQQGGVSINDVKCTECDVPTPESGAVLRVGKRKFLRLI
jgi:tyrosyl-tRNA synthetase